MRLRLALFLTAAAIIAPARAASACGGGLVTTTQAATLGANAQRILISVHGGMTDVITQIGVPATTADYGVLIPVAGQPTLDPVPVASADLDALDRMTRPYIVIQHEAGGGGGCGCPIVAGSDKSNGTDLVNDVQVSQPVTIGPITAVTLTADTGDAINAWLAANGFVIPAADQAIVDSYSGPGRYLIAIKRSNTAATGGETSVGVHFTLAGDQRALPLRFARLGAAPTVAFTVFVAADGAIGPAAPFEALTLTDLQSDVRSMGYGAAVARAESLHANRAFVIEGTWTSSLSNALGPSLQPFLTPGQTLTRLSIVVPASALDTDVVFDQPFTGVAPNQIYVQGPGGPAESPKFASLGFVLLAFGAVVRRRPRP